MCGWITKQGQRVYKLTRGDFDVMARMLVGESSDRADRIAQLWTLAQRFVMRDFRYEQTMTELAYNFSQPINPKWARDGEYCQPGHPKYSTQNCNERKYQRREQIAALGPGDARYDEAYALIESWAKGQIPNPVERSIDWHATRLAPGNTQIGNYPNVFQGNRVSMRWPDGYVGIEPAPCAKGLSLKGVLITTAVLGVFGGALYAAAILGDA